MDPWLKHLSHSVRIKIWIPRTHIKLQMVAPICNSTRLGQKQEHVQGLTNQPALGNAEQKTLPQTKTDTQGCPLTYTQMPVH